MEEQVAWVWIGEVGDRARQAAGVYGAGFTARSLGRVGARDGTRS